MNDERINSFDVLRSPSLGALSRNERTSWSKYRKCLSINYGSLLANMLLPWIMIAVPIIFYPEKLDFFFGGFLTIPTAIWFAFWLNAYNLHFHEASHYNLHPNKLINDILATILLTPFVGMPIGSYRVSHWQHHRFLGELEDTEISYRSALSFKNLVEGLVGIYLLRMLRKYFINFQSNNPRKVYVKKNSSIFFVATLALMLVIQMSIIFLLSWCISIYLGVAWAISFFMIVPLMGKVRQTLEHRSFSARRNIDYSGVVHGPQNRIFSRDLFSRFFGAAGFNSHLLHHLDPTVSYTRFSEMESFMLRTSLKDLIDANRSTYYATFKKLLLND